MDEPPFALVCGWRYPLLIIAKGGSFSTVSTLRLFSSTSIACGFLYEIFQNRDFHDSGGFKNASQDPSKSRCNKTKENDTEMSETDPFYSEEADGMSKRTQLEEYFSQSLEIDLLLRLCPDDEDIIYQIVDLSLIHI